MMEIIIAIAIATMATSHSLKNTIVDGWYGLKGRPSPRMVRAAQRRDARANRQRSAFARYRSDLWRDSWTDVHRKHAQRRARRQKRQAAPRGAFHQWTDALRSDAWDRWDASWNSRAAKRRTKANWRKARNLADMGNLTARWLEGGLVKHPTYDGPPDPETRGIVPVLADLNRNGFVTEGSQPGYSGPGHDGAHWAQRASVSGFADRATAQRLKENLPDDFMLVIHDPADETHEPGVVVTTRDGEPYTQFGDYLDPRYLRSAYGDCDPAVRDDLVDAQQVTIVDPVWGRTDALWPAVVTSLRSKPVPPTPESVVVPADTTPPRSDLRFGPDDDPTGVRDCPICHGTAVVDGKPCASCVGRQHVRAAHWDAQDEWHVTDRDGTQFITTDDPQLHRDQGRTVRPVGKPGCPNCHGTGRWRDIPCTACQPVDPDHVWPDHPTDTYDDSYRSTPTTEGNNMTTTTPTGEVTGLSTAITNATSAAASAEAWPPALEQFAAGLAANEVGEGVLLLVAQAQEQFAMAAATMRDVEAALTKQRSVQEAYQANPDAGNKQFVTND